MYMRKYKGIRMDRIDERNFREKVKKSIIKNWNIHYVSKEELNRKKQEEELRQAQEILDRLNREAAQDEAVKQNEIDELLRQKELEKSYNRTTGAYSGEYGKQRLADAVAKEKVEKILAEKNEELFRTIEESKHSDPKSSDEEKSE